MGFLSNLFPDVKCRISGGVIRVEGLFEARQEAKRRLAGVTDHYSYFTIAASATNAYDLMQALDKRYKVKVDDAFLRLLESYHNISHLVNRGEIHVDQKFPIKPGAHKRWKHQEIALERALKHPFFGCFMEMGAGKSRVVVDVVDMKQDINKVLIMAPKSVVTSNVWSNQFNQYSMTFAGKVFELAGSIEERAESLSNFLRLAHKFVVVLNYEAIWREPIKHLIENGHFDLIVADEVHRLKSAGSNTSLAAYHFSKNVKYRMGLSGTPLADKPLDAYGVYRFLDATIFGTNFTRFRDRYAVMGGYRGYTVKEYKNLDELHRKMYSIAYRVTKDVLDLPPIVEIEREFELSAKAKTAYKKFEKELTLTVAGDRYNATNALVKILRLQQITSGFLPSLDDDIDLDRENTNSPHNIIDDSRRRVLKEILEDLPEQEPVVVFCRFVEDLRSIRAVCKEVGREYKELSGHIKQNNEWSAGKGNVLGVQIASGSAGIDLTRASFGIYYSLDHRLVNYDQSMSRMHRPGQKADSVRYVFIKAKDTVDEDILFSVRNKMDIVKVVVDKTKNVNNIKVPEKKRSKRA